MAYAALKGRSSTVVRVVVVRTIVRAGSREKQVPRFARNDKLSKTENHKHSKA